MEYKIIWSDSAIADLREICGYISRDNPSAAATIGRKILDHVKILAAFPMIGPAYPRGSSGTRREIVCLNYRIFYKVSSANKTVEILHVWHGARGEPPAMP